MHDENGTKVLVKGIDLTKNMLENALDKYNLLVTFNGIRFDVPFIEHSLNMDLQHIPHLDLMYTLRRVGFRGGLKKIEKELGFVRDDEIASVDGLEAVRLWYRWERKGDFDALTTLIKYNVADVENLRELARISYEMLEEETLSEAQIYQ